MESPAREVLSLGPGTAFDNLVVHGEVCAAAINGQLHVINLAHYAEAADGSAQQPPLAIQQQTMQLPLPDRKLVSKIQLSLSQLVSGAAYLLAASQNNELLIYGSETKQKAVRTYTAKKPLSCIDWSCHDPNVLAFSSNEESQISIYDIREKKPTMTLQTQAGCTQARWNCWASFMLASASGDRVRIWDIRTRSVSNQFQVPGVKRLCSLDWNPDIQDELLTCSASTSADSSSLASAYNKSVLVWSVRKPSCDVLCGLRVANVQRAGFTPFGRGIVTCALAPQALPHEAVISVWPYDQVASQETPTEVLSISGYVDFGWHRIRSDEGEVYQLISRSAGGLCVTQSTADLNVALGYNSAATQPGLLVGHGSSTVAAGGLGATGSAGLATGAGGRTGSSSGVSDGGDGLRPSATAAGSTRPSLGSSASTTAPSTSSGGLGSRLLRGFGSRSSTSAEASSAAMEAETRAALTSEFNRQRRTALKDMLVTRSDPASRTCEFSLAVGALVEEQGLAFVSMYFPAGYPRTGLAPSFSLRFSSPPRGNVKQKLLEELETTAKKLVRLQKPCLEDCMRSAAEAVQKLQKAMSANPAAFGLSRTHLLQEVLKAPSEPLHSDMRRMAPTCGARFSVNGTLVIFTNRSKHLTDAESRARNDLRWAGTLPQASSTSTSSQTLAQNQKRMAGQLTSQSGLITRPSGDGSKPGSQLVLDSRNLPATTAGNVTALAAQPNDGTTSRAGSVVRLPHVRVRPASTVGAAGAQDAGTGGTANVHNGQRLYPSRVEMLDLSSLTRIYPSLCHDYVLLSAAGPTAACRMNAVAAKRVNRSDLVQVWAVLAQALAKPMLMQPMLWASHPCGGGAVRQLLNHYHERRETQAVAAIAAVTASYGLDLISPLKIAGIFLDSALQRQVLAHMTAYAEILRLMGLLLTAAEINKAAGLLQSETVASIVARSIEEAAEKGVRQIEDFVTTFEPVVAVQEASPSLEIDCIPYTSDGRWTEGAKKAGGSSQDFKPLHCAVCRLKATKFTMCPKCGHGGHYEHLRLWFAVEQTCPSGCGCPCQIMEYRLEGEAETSIAV